MIKWIGDILIVFPDWIKIEIPVKCNIPDLIPKDKKKKAP